MTRLLVRRLAASAVLLVLLLTFSFFLLHLAPGEPAVLLLDPRVSPAQAERLRAVYRLDRPLVEQYLAWLAACGRGEWGVSFVHGRPVGELLAATLPHTLALSTAALLLEFGLGLALGGAAARRAGGAADHVLRLGTLTLYSIPSFWLGLMALLLFAMHWPLFPPGDAASTGAAALPLLGRSLDRLHHLALPALVLGLASAGRVARFARAALLEGMGQEWARAARARGASLTRVVWLHALRHGAGPLVQLAGLSLPFLLSGALVIEVVFSWPGMGRLAWQALRSQDYPVVLAGTALTGCLVIAGGLAADLAQAWLDPRLRDAP